MNIKNLIRVDKAKIHNINVEDKFRLTFKQIIVMFCAAVAMLTITVVSSGISVSRLYNTYYTMNTIQGDIRIDMQALSKAFLWALSSPDEAIRKEQLQKAMDKFGEFEDNLSKLSKVMNNSDSISLVSKDLKTVEENGKKLGDMFSANAGSEELFYYFNDTLYPSIDVAVKDFKAVSSASTDEAAKAYKTSLVFCIIMSVITLIVVILVMLYIVDVKSALSESILKPVEEISKAADKMATGNLHINIDYESKDELGRLAKDLNSSTSVTEQIITDIRETLLLLSNGDFTHGTLKPELYKNDFAQISEALTNITDSLSDTLSHVRDSSNHVSDGANGMSTAASDLAEGTANQAAAVQELNASVSTITSQTKNMAEIAERSEKMADKVREDADASARKMSLVTEAMVRITEASNEIEQVTNTIESIAKQTQLLALNASIEAARAGESGRGFAVVADEISTLASQSTNAAKNTYQLIQDTMSEIKNGNAVVGETTDALQNMQQSVESITTMIVETGDMAKLQASSMSEISIGIEQISSVVQSNSETAQQSNALSRSLNEQAENLIDIINKFNLK